MKIGLCSDHAGVEYKAKLISYLLGKGYEVVNFGTDSTESCDYPDFAHPLGSAVESGECDLGIAICGTGIGISLVCNKYKGIRCALCTNEFMAKMCRQHNDAQILAFGERVVGLGVALGMIDAFFEEEFAGGRHATRVNGIKEIEEKHFK